MPEPIRILLIVLSVPTSLAFSLQLVHFLVVLFRLFEVLRQEVVDLDIMARLFAFRILSVFICDPGFLFSRSISGPMRLKSDLLRYDTQVKRASAG